MQDVLARHCVRPSKALGQNFVVDPNTLRKVVRIAAPGPHDVVLEIGPGAGGLTLELARVAGRVVAVELDRALLPVLAETLAGVANVTVVHADAMRLDLAATGANRLVANLPYNIAAGVVVRALLEAPEIAALTVMIQREVGERLVATPGTKAYGHVSVVVAFLADASIATRVSRNAFYPVPGVDSVVLNLVRKGSHEDVDLKRFVEVVRASFSQRRKTLRNALASLAGSPVDAQRALEAARISPAARAEELDLESFVGLARCLGA